MDTQQIIAQFLQLSIENKIDIVIAILTFILASIALFQWRGNRKAHKQAHLPLLKSDIRQPSAQENGRVTLTNSGLGPALLQEINIYFEGEKVDGELREACEFVIRQLGDKAGVPIEVDIPFSYQKGYPIGRDEVIPLVEFRFLGQPNPDEIELEMAKRNLQIKVIYRDIFGKRHSIIDPRPGRSL